MIFGFHQKRGLLINIIILLINKIVVLHRDLISCCEIVIDLVVLLSGLV